MAEKIDVICADCKQVVTMGVLYTNGDGPCRCQKCATDLYKKGLVAICEPTLKRIFIDVASA